MNTVKVSAAAIVVGFGPENPLADVAAGSIFIVGRSYALGTLVYDHLNGASLNSTEVQGSDSKPEKNTSNSKSTKDAKGQAKGSLSETKNALADAKKKLGLEPGDALTKGEQGKYGSPCNTLYAVIQKEDID